MKMLKTRFVTIILSFVMLFGFFVPSTLAYAASGDTIVYKTKTGECYHKDGCSSLKKSKIEITLQEAVNSKLRACSKYKPPVLDAKSTTSSVTTSVASVTASSDKSTVKTEISFIGNASSKKFHKPTCASVAQMKPENKVELSGTRDEIIKQGYDPCKNCKP